MPYIQLHDKQYPLRVGEVRVGSGPDAHVPLPGADAVHAIVELTATGSSPEFDGTVATTRTVVSSRAPLERASATSSRSASPSRHVKRTSPSGRRRKRALTSLKMREIPPPEFWIARMAVNPPATSAPMQSAPK